MRPALFVQDIQNTWLYDHDSNQDLRRSLEKRIEVINEAIAWFRGRRLPIIVGYTEDKEHGLFPGTIPFEVPESINIRDTDFKVTKRNSNAFGDPKLGAILHENGCDTIVIVGLSASGCVLATYFGAPDCDIHPYLLKGGVASHKEEHVRFAEEICDTLTLSELETNLRKSIP
jgi:nicotinamidase-related amidase